MLLTEWKYFDRFIIACIFMNSLVLALFDYSDRDAETTKNQVLEYIGLVFTVIFTLECMLKVISMGFVMHRHAYLRDSWNTIDFVVVIAG